MFAVLGKLLKITRRPFKQLPEFCGEFKPVGFRNVKSVDYQGGLVTDMASFIFPHNVPFTVNNLKVILY
ncbi:hypothetical protein L2725_17530 [Shewanella corallii]|uniref:Uncharacterized protein n=1 Tax=Shewanella corallii TaxID=560080 RepID=A0ABT0NAW6_9GAMM|nr:hypothetical protein [Shewanella corallii]MCL2915559.1 hypothetical protein [Shewanella corallii]